MHLHVKLNVSELPEPHAANFTLVRFLPSVDPQVSQVVGVDPERLAALIASMWFVSGVLQFVGLESLKDDEPLPAHLAAERPLSRVDPLMVIVGGLVEKRLPACVAVVLQLTYVNQLVSFQ